MFDHPPRSTLISEFAAVISNVFFVTKVRAAGGEGIEGRARSVSVAHGHRRGAEAVVPPLLQGLRQAVFEGGRRLQEETERGAGTIALTFLNLQSFQKRHEIELLIIPLSDG